MIQKSQSHEFALFAQGLHPLLKNVPANTAFNITDTDLINRIINVLRLKQGEQFILFDHTMHCQCIVDSLVSKKTLSVTLISKQQPVVLKPEITLILPILKKEDFESALYNATALGVTKIQLLTTQKIQRAWQGTKEFERCQRILISACEQAKNFALPELLMPIALHDVFAQLPTNCPKIFFDPEGKPSFDVMQQLYNQKPASLILAVGPEGDLTDAEKTLLQSNNFIFCALTPTILRSVDAVTLGLGMARSFLR